MSGSLSYAIQGTEGSGPQDVSPRGAVGTMQVTRPFFDQFAAPGEDFSNEADRRRVAERGLRYYQAKYQDPARVAVAYFSGPGNVSPPGSKYPWIENRNDGHTTVSQYVQSVMGRLGVKYDYNHPQISREEDAELLSGGREQGQDIDINLSPGPDNLGVGRGQKNWNEHLENPNWMAEPIPTQHPANSQGLPQLPGANKAMFHNSLGNILRQWYPRAPWRT